MEIYSSEEQQVEAIKRFWQQYGKAIVAGVAIGLVALYGFRYYQAQQRSNAETASAGFNQLIEQRESGNPEDWLAQAQGFIAKSDDNTYAIFAALVAAKEAVDAQKPDVATERLQWAVTHAKDSSVKAIAQLRLARIQKDQGNYDAALTTLNTAVPESFVALQAELKGDILLLSGKAAEAKTAYQQALAVAGENAQLLQVKLDDLAHVTAA